MKTYESWALTLQQGVHAGSNLWFIVVLISVHPEWPEEWRDLRILFALNIGTAILNGVIYMLVWCLRREK